ncbi:polysaccharide deacetylase family protein [soil metagenome]
MARIALKVDVDTLRGTLEGVPRLLELLDRHSVRATFLFSLGPDHTGWALRRAFRPGFLTKVSRTSVLEHYGLKTLLYGVLLPAPDIGRKARGAMQAVRRAGHECGIHCWDHVVWQDNVRHRDAAWTRNQMAQAHEAFTDIFGELPATHGAAGWQMNDDAYRQIDAWQMTHASDSRGDGPFVPRIGGVDCRHVQLPTTLPTLDELIGVDGITADDVHRHLLGLTEAGDDQVFTLHAELEGGRLSGTLDRLLSGWHAQGHHLMALAELQAGLDRARLPRREIGWGSVPGRSGTRSVALPA